MEPDSALSKELVMVCLRIFVFSADVSLFAISTCCAGYLYLSCRML
ncbi:hypothetical protein SynSYN20_01949 [Synechococcus sp. SYN20]|nr:hypothetical protein SynSYN20_01949 [Synechococcus sp. SYN20]